MLMGLYSARAATKYGTSLYLHEKGHEVEITAVCKRDPQLMREYELRWPDAVFVGHVTKFLHRKRAPENPMRKRKCFTSLMRAVRGQPKKSLG